jgi:hypothetical protein
VQGFFGAEAKEFPMLSIVLQVLAGWVAASVVIGLIIGALIQSAEKVQIEEMFNDLFSFLAKRQSTR